MAHPNAGADPNKRVDGSSPLEIAIENDYTEIVNILIGTSN